MIEWLNELGSWAWARHHNELSWYIRPLFLLPFGYFAYRRSITGIVVTLVALATSMAWFPAPEHPSPEAVAFLAAEREYLLGEWTPAKLAAGLVVPLVFVGLALALWRRSFGWALVTINFGVLFKIGWSFVVGDVSGGLALLPSALGGLIVLNGVFWFVAHRKRVVPS